MVFKKYIYICVLALLVGASGSAYGYERPDSTVIFKFKVNKNQFWYDYNGNRVEFDKLANFLFGNRAKVRRGEMPIYIAGYTTSMPTLAENLELAKIRSNHVKSYLISLYGFRESFFRTKNHADSLEDLSEIVVVSFTVPKVKDVARVEPEIIDIELAKSELPRDSIVAYRAPRGIVFDVDPPVRKHWWKDQIFENSKSYALLEKGSYYFSAYGNFKQAETSNLLIEPLFDVKSMSNLGVDISFGGGYFIDNNVAIGAYGGYSFSDMRLNVSSDLLQLLINHKEYETNNVSAGFQVGAFVKNFIPLEYTNRIYAVSETAIHYSQTRSLQRNVYDRGALLSKVMQNTYMGGLRLSMGVMYFLKPGLTLEFNISPVAAYYTYNEVLNNEVLNGKFSGGSVLTVLMPLDLRFGVTYFLGLDYKRHKRYIDHLQSTIVN